MRPRSRAHLLWTLAAIKHVAERIHRSHELAGRLIVETLSVTMGDEVLVSMLRSAGCDKRGIKRDSLAHVTILIGFLGVEQGDVIGVKGRTADCKSGVGQTCRATMN